MAGPSGPSPEQLENAREKTRLHYQGRIDDVEAQVRNLDLQEGQARDQIGLLPKHERVKQGELDGKRKELEGQAAQLKGMEKNFANAQEQLQLAARMSASASDFARQQMAMYLDASWKFYFGGIMDHLTDQYAKFTEVLHRVFAAMSRLQGAVAAFGGATVYARDASGAVGTRLSNGSPPEYQGVLNAENNARMQAQNVEQQQLGLKRQENDLQTGRERLGLAEQQIEDEAKRVAQTMDLQRQQLEQQLRQLDANRSNMRERIDQLEAEREAQLAQIDEQATESPDA